MVIRQKNNKESGFSMLEMLIAMTILAIGLLGIAALQIVAIQGSAYSIKYNQATVHISDKFEKLKNTPFAHITIETTEETIGDYTIKTTITASEHSSSLKEVLIEATWQDKAGKKPHRISYQTVIGQSSSSS